MGLEWDYFGELDSNGNACGYGIARYSSFVNLKYEGTFLDNKYHGICM